MRTPKVRTYYGKLAESRLITLAGKIVEEMTNNPYFPDPQIPITTLAELVADFRKKAEIALNGGSAMDRELKKESRTALVKGLRILGHYVNIKANGNQVALSSSGMILHKEHAPKEKPYIVEGIRLKDTKLSGQIRVDFHPQRHVDEYEIQWGEWDHLSHKMCTENTRFTSTSINNVLEPVIPAQRYYVRVRARNNKGFGNWSEPVSIIAR